MTINMLPIFVRQNHNTGRKHLNTQLAASIVLLFFLLSGMNARAEPDKNYLRIAKSKVSDTIDLETTSIGALVFQKNMMGHVDLTQLESIIDGKSLVLEFGGGYVFNWDVSLFLGFGISAGYNSGNNDYITAYYPEAGIVLDVTRKFGLTVNTKRYHHLYKENEAIVTVGFVFRN